jgi:hypothetical protein
MDGLRVETCPFNMTAGLLVLNGRNLEGPIPICAIKAEVLAPPEAQGSGDLGAGHPAA